MKTKTSKPGAIVSKPYKVYEQLFLASSKRVIKEYKTERGAFNLVEKLNREADFATMYYAEKLLTN